MAVSFVATLRNARLDLVTGKIDAGAGPGQLHIYDGTRPAIDEAVSGQTLLATFTFANPSAAAASAGVLTFNAIADTTALADGTATWARAVDSDGQVVADFDVTTAGAGGDITLDEISFTTGNTRSVETATLTEGNI